ncbi:bifunctional 3'-5' exonuclease/DNA polymerase [Nakamurella alba]|uniref:bifunctional 3'-5' exonuclease/DNA polymerase n=1 Tax=Nakamurella alba TaxID=2665158 RepID=UPI002AC33CC5|nr:bifunctional 3'-5' exonuclease/DNA polymerase [Nakamurella alba]
MLCALAPSGAGWVARALDDAGTPTGPVTVLPDRAALQEFAASTAPGVRWLWDATTSVYPPLLAAGIRVDRVHDVTLTERILLGRESRHAEPSAAAAVYARRHGLPVPDDPVAEVAPAVEPGLFMAEPSAPSRPEADWDPLDVLAEAFRSQAERSAGENALRLLIAAESASALAAAEMGAAGLPLRASVHDRQLTDLLGARPPAGVRPPKLAQLAAGITEAFGYPVNPDSAVDLRSAFQRAGFDISTTRSWVIKDLDHPAVPEVLEYKELSRLFTANGWNWLDEWVRGDRFHAEYLPGGVVTGRWAARGGGGLQIPKLARRAVLAEPGHVFVAADAAQLEPRVLAAISGDPALLAVSADEDLYTALADDGFGGDRAHAKVAMLGAMYGATTGESGRLLPVLRRRYPVAMATVEQAAHRGEQGGVVRSVLGRTSPPPSASWRATVLAGSLPDAGRGEQARAREVARAWGRFTRNFVVQGSAADWAAVWLSGVRREIAAVPGAELVFFQHDELLVHVPAGSADVVAELVVGAADEAKRLVFPGSPVSTPVRPVVVECYADAK